MTNLSKNLTLEEVIKSDVAIRLGIDNTPTKDHLRNLTDLAENIFQKIRNYFEKPIYISSGYRSEKLNKKIGGAKNSQHTIGEAIDIDMDGKSYIKNIDIFNYIKNELTFDQLIYEFENPDGGPSWVHVSYSFGNNRKQILKSSKKDGKTIYIELENDFI